MFLYFSTFSFFSPVMAMGEEELEKIVTSSSSSSQAISPAQGDQEKLDAYIASLPRYNIGRIMLDKKEVELTLRPASRFLAFFGENYVSALTMLPSLQELSITLNLSRKELSLEELRSAVGLARENPSFIKIISKNNTFWAWGEKERTQCLLGALLLRNALIRGDIKDLTYNFFSFIDNEIEDILSEGIQKTDSLETFNVCINGRLGTKAIEGIRENKSIKSADLSFYYRTLVPSEVDNLTYFIVNSPSLKSLDLTISLDAPLLMNLANVLKHESLSLEKLALRLAKDSGSEQQVMEEATASFLEALQINKSLRVLYFGFPVSLVHTKILGDSLKHNTTLKVLATPGAKIGDEGLIFLAEGLKENRSLTEIDLSSTNLTDRGADVLRELLQINVSLKSLHLGGNTISDSKKTKINQILRERRAVSASSRIS